MSEMGRGRVRTQTSPGSTNYLSKFTLLYRISRFTELLQETKLLHEAPRPRFDTASVNPGNCLPFSDVWHSLLEHTFNLVPLGARS